MFASVLRFELRYQLRQPLFLISAAVFFLLGFIGTASERLTIGGDSGNLDLNAAFTIMQNLQVFALFALFLVVAFVAGPLIRDVDRHTAEQFFTTGVSRRAYLYGRFAGGVLVAWAALSAGLLGLGTALWMPWLDPERFGAFSLMPYLFSVVFIALPGIFVPAAIFCYVIAVFRALSLGFAAAAVMVAATITLGFFVDPENASTMALFDPFGMGAFTETTRYWTVFDRNTQVLPLDSVWGANRAIWVAVGCVFLLLTDLQFRLSLDKPRLLPTWLRWRRRAKASEAAGVPAVAIRRAPVFDGLTAFRQCLSQARLETLTVVRSVPFIVLLLLGGVNVFGYFYGAINSFVGTPVYPYTYILTGGIASAFSLFAWVIVIWYTGELAQRERVAGVAEMVDAMPWPNWVPMIAKLLTMAFVVTAVLTAAVLMAVLMQLLNGFYQIDPASYLVGVYYAQGTSLVIIAAIGLFLQSATGSRYVGMLAMVAVMLLSLSLSGFGYEHMLNALPAGGMPGTDMNGFGHFLEPLSWHFVYWAGICITLLAVAHTVWPRGMDLGLKARWSRIGMALNGPAGLVAGIGVVIALGAGSWIFWNTTILNDYIPAEESERLLAEYEKRHADHAFEPQPDVIDIDYTLDIFPAERRLAVRGEVLLENNHDAPFETLSFSVPTTLDRIELSMEGMREDTLDEETGYYEYVLDRPLMPGERRQMTFEADWDNPGFANNGQPFQLVENGTFFDNSTFMPAPGYQPAQQLQDNNIRRRHDLPPAERWPDLDDASQFGRNSFGMARRAAFAATVSTSADQIAVAPGYLEKEWEEGGRRYFRYVMDEPIWPFVGVLSARYERVVDAWNDVAIEVFFHPGHAWNVDRMIASTKDSLDYFTTEFSPYRYKQFRIFEFPAYRSFAQSFPNTIPYSEAIGFIADQRDPEDIDFVYYVTAHELAHQWWGHQVSSAFVQGQTAIVETLAQYSALMVMEREYGRDRMRRFLKYELDRYLSGRGGEVVEEQPLMRVENQPYVHYRKGSLVMYALKDYLGEEAVNRALRAVIAEHGMSEGHFPTARTLVNAFRAEAGEEQQDLITDLWEKIVVFDIRATGVEVEDLPDGSHRVVLEAEATKFEADGAGEEQEVPLDMLMDVGLLVEREGDESEVLVMEKRRVTSGTNRFEFVVDQVPDAAGLDPLNILIDRDPNDNRVSL